MSTPTPPDLPTPAAAPAGYDPLFLSAGLPDPLPVPLPMPPASASASAVRELPSTHFTVVLDLARRLAVATGVNLDGPALLDLDRGDDWHLDARVPADQQTGPEVYANNDLDRGHLVRRRDPVWGSAEVATQANFDTFAYTNAAPQAALFNQGETLWAGLEDYVLDHARTYAQRLSVFTAPVLDSADPPYRGVQIPLRFWKIAAWAQTPDPDAPDGSSGDATGRGEPDAAAVMLAATGYVLDQTPQLDDLDLDLATARALAAGSPPPLGPFSTFQVPIADIAALTGLDLGPLVTADRLPTPAPADAGQLTPATVGASGRWQRLASHTDIAL